MEETSLKKWEIKGRDAPPLLPDGLGAMALPWVQRIELVLFAAAFVCGAVAAATLTRTQVLPCGAWASLGVGEARSLAGAGQMSSKSFPSQSQQRVTALGRASVYRCMSLT
jgi:hypothetical protein